MRLYLYSSQVFGDINHITIHWINLIGLARDGEALLTAHAHKYDVTEAGVVNLPSPCFLAL